MNALQLFLKSKSKDELRSELNMLHQFNGPVQSWFAIKMQLAFPEDFEDMHYKEEIIKALYDSPNDLFRVKQLEQQIQVFEDERAIYNLYIYVCLFMLDEINIYTSKRKDFTSRLLIFGLQIYNNTIHLINQHIFDEEIFLAYRMQLRRIAGDAIFHPSFNYHEELHHAFDHM